MKKFLLAFVVALVVFRGNAQTNVYHPFPDSAFWRVDYHVNSPMGGGCLALYYFQYYSSGDTLINSIIHRKIYKSYVALTSSGAAAPCNPIPGFEFSGYVGALRDDSLSNRAFMIFPTKNTDSLLYDYNLVVGDTIKGIITNNCKTVVQSVDSVLINAQYRKRWNFDACGHPNCYIIEGIGSKAGLIEHINGGNPWYDLVCVKDGASTLFTSSYSSPFGCNLVYSGINESGFNGFMEIYPNPTSGIFKLSISEMVSSVKILNILGNTVWEQTIQEAESEIDLTTYPKGVYFLKVTDEKGNFGVRKIVFQ